MDEQSPDEVEIEHGINNDMLHHTSGSLDYWAEQSSYKHEIRYGDKIDDMPHQTGGYLGLHFCCKKWVHLSHFNTSIFNVNPPISHLRQPNSKNHPQHLTKMNLDAQDDHINLKVKGQYKMRCFLDQERHAIQDTLECLLS
ncbi:hypothetical protein RND71_030647 [Anisodus tanguticus]|uniref:Uncharacterized protein n=1 Tax=Anisodus tanguticus TaxID=243964 RepID=A0AAE1RHK3_9SOLA|nr:hypothetical protein RND71_030647 [Anisodus tanguticus]